MIFRFINRLRLINFACLIFSILCMLTGLAFLGTGFFAVIYSFPIWFVIVFLLVIISVTGIIFEVIRFDGYRRGIYGKFEGFIFGQRTLIIDSLEEFRRKKNFSESLETELESNGLVLKFFVKESKALIIRTLIAFAVTFLFLILAALSIPSAINKYNAVTDFLTFTPDWDIPHYYIQSRPLEIDLSDKTGAFDEIKILTADTGILDSEGVFTFDASITSQEEITITIVARKYGIKRELLTQTMNATTRLLPNRLDMQVVYPFRTDNYSGLQDLEVWEGASLRISGNFTKELDSATITPSVRGSIDIDKNRFALSFNPRGDTRYAVTFVSKDNDSYISPHFRIKTMPNSAPSITLLFPLQDVTITHHRWNVHSIVESEDELGLTKLIMNITVTNRNPRLPYTSRSSLEIPLGNERYIKRTLRFTYRETELLPGDVASIELYTRDVFSLNSSKVGFNIISPDFDDLMALRERLHQSIEERLQNLEHRFDELKRDYEQENLAGAKQKTREIEESIEQARSDISQLSETYLPDETAIREIRESLEKMREISEELKKHSETMSRLTELMEKDRRQFRNIDPSELDFKKTLESISSFLKNLDYYKELAELINRINLLERTYETLKEQDNPELFNRNLDLYKEQLSELQKHADGRIKDLVKELQEEAGKLEMGNAESFERSDSLINELKSETRQRMGQAQEKRTQERINRIKKIIEELYINQIVAINTLQIDKTFIDPSDTSNIDRVVENVNAINVSVRHSRKELESAIEGLTFEGETRREIENLFERNEKTLDFIITALRDHKISEVDMGMKVSANLIATISLYLLKINAALEEAMSQSNEGMQQEMMTLGLGDLMRMQAQISLGLSQALEEMMRSGGLSEEMQGMLDEMARLQKEIYDNFAEMLKGEGEGLISGGSEINRLMDDLIKEIESYNIDDDSLAKSKKLEQKLLDAQKGIQAKGLSEERKAERPEEFTLTPPEEFAAQTPERVELDEIRSRTVAEYYRTLIQKYFDADKK